jgi:hypothetical protein
VIKKEAEEIQNINPLTIGLQGMWEIKTKVVPVRVRETVTV